MKKHEKTQKNPKKGLFPENPPKPYDSSRFWAFSEKGPFLTKITFYAKPKKGPKRPQIPENSTPRLTTKNPTFSTRGSKTTNQTQTFSTNEQTLADLTKRTQYKL